ncbi:hypothetical protein GQ457_14G013690 [Hibiscus cannabinus]
MDFLTSKGLRLDNLKSECAWCGEGIEDQSFRDLSKNQKDLLVFTKIRALIWIKALNEKILLKEDSWWDDPIASLGPSNSELAQDWIPPDSGCLKFNVDRAFNMLGAGCGGVLCLSNGDMRAIFFWTSGTLWL